VSDPINSINAIPIQPEDWNELDVLRDISKRFTELGIPFMLTGSLAMNYYAVPRMTRDIDLVVALEFPQVELMVNNFTPDYLIVREAVEDAVSRQYMFNAIHEASLIKADFMCRKHTPFRHEEFNRRERITIEDFDTWIVSKEDLILSKLEWMRESLSELQQRDIRNLLDSEIDREYLERWANSLQLSDLLAWSYPPE